MEHFRVGQSGAERCSGAAEQSWSTPYGAKELLNLPFKLIFGEAQQGLNFLSSEDILWMGCIISALLKAALTFFENGFPDIQLMSWYQLLIHL